MNFGLFGLGDEVIGKTGEVCEFGWQGCRAAWPVHCLTTNLPWLEGSKARRAQAVATAWGGSIDHASLCSNERRLEEGTVGTHLACQIRAGAVGGGAGAVSAALRSEDFSSRIVARTETLLSGTSDALQGTLSLA